MEFTCDHKRSTNRETVAKEDGKWLEKEHAKIFFEKNLENSLADSEKLNRSSITGAEFENENTGPAAAHRNVRELSGVEL